MKFSNDPLLLTNLNIDGFFVGWPNPPSNETFKKILCKSQHVVLAIENEKLVGFINAISDETLSAYIPLLEVLPNYKGQGIGTELVERMKSELKNYYMIDISCDDDVVAFYEKLSFRKNNSMYLRNYAKQSGQQSS